MSTLSTMAGEFKRGVGQLVSEFYLESTLGEVPRNVWKHEDAPFKHRTLPNRDDKLHLHVLLVDYVFC